MRYLLLRLKRFCGFITGFVFFLSGIVKLMDPVGAGLVMKEYLDFLHIGFLGFASKPLGVLFALAETIVGTGLITGVWRRIIAPTAIALQGFFTFLTLLLVIFNPEMDCGCFGEAIHLTHAQTFIKNLVLMALLLIYYIPSRHLGETRKKKYVSFGIVTLSVVAFTIYSWLYIPLIDFTDFKPAAALQAGNAFQTPEEDMYEAYFIYEKDGTQERFTLGHLPDSTWTFVTSETVLKKEYEDALVNLSFYDNDGEYHDTLAAGGKVMVISVYAPKKINEREWKRIGAFIADAQDTGFRPIILVAGTEEDIPEQYSGMTYQSDYKTLITLNRSNGGATYFSNGYLIRKWAERALPDKEKLTETADGDDTETLIGEDANRSLTFQGFLLYVFAVMLLL